MLVVCLSIKMLYILMSGRILSIQMQRIHWREDSVNSSWWTCRANGSYWEKSMSAYGYSRVVSSSRPMELSKMTWVVRRREAYILLVRTGDVDQDIDDEDEGFVSGDNDTKELDDEEEEINEYPEHTGRPGFVAKDDVDDEEEAGEDVAFAESDSDMFSVSVDEGSAADLLADEFDVDDDEEDGGLRWKENLAERARKLHASKVAFRAAELSKLVYDPETSPAEVMSQWAGYKRNADIASQADQDNEESFFKKAKTDQETNLEDRYAPRYDYDQLAEKWEDEDQIQTMMRRFTKNSLAMGANTDSEANGKVFDPDEDGDFGGDGDFEDLEAAAEDDPETKAELTLEEERAKNAKRKEELKLRFEEEDREGFANAVKNDVNAAEQEYGEDEWYDAQKAMLQKQLDINRAEFATSGSCLASAGRGLQGWNLCTACPGEGPLRVRAVIQPQVPRHRRWPGTD